MRRLSAVLAKGLPWPVKRVPRAVPVLVLSAILPVLLAGGASSALATAPPVVPPYGEVARFGSFDSIADGAQYGPSSTSGLQEAIGEEARFVYPVGMAVNTEEADAPDGYAIYVLDNLNPQAVNLSRFPNGELNPALSLEYRIQKMDESGKVLGSTRFTLASSEAELDLHAVSLAVDGRDGRVYVLIADARPTAEPGHPAVDAYEVDAWTTMLTPADGAGELPEDPATHAGELAGPDTLHPLQGATFTGDLNGESIAVDGNGPDADLALAGNRYVTEYGSTVPAIERIKTEGAEAGALDGEWANAAATEDPAAKAAGRASSELYSLSTNPDGSLTATLGGTEFGQGTDREPNLATLSTDLSTTAAELPWADTAEDYIDGRTRDNVDRGATTSFPNRPSGGSPNAGTLAPSVVQLAGDGVSYPDGLYAGLVANANVGEGGEDPQAPRPNSGHTWRLAEPEFTEVGIGSAVGHFTKASNLGIRVFDADEANHEESSLAMIGNVVAGGPCNLQGTTTEVQNAGGSFVALAAGREGVLFALVQPDLRSTSQTTPSGEVIDPSSPLGAGLGEDDQVVEFAPGASSTGAGANASHWKECPQPSGSFSVADEGEPLTPSADGELAVLAGATLQFDAGAVNLRGASPWAYDWDLEGGINQAGEGPVFDHVWAVAFRREEAWRWPSPTVEAKFSTPGIYSEKLSLVNDFGTLSAQQKLRVIEPGAITNTSVAPVAKPTEGVPALLAASATFPQGDKVKDYHWEFGDGQSEDTGEVAEAEHTYAKAGLYTVALTITDVLGQKAEAKETVTVAAAPVAEKEKEVEQGPGRTSTPAATTPPATNTTSPPPPAPPVKPKPLTTAQKLASALKTCRKIKAKKSRASCEKQAKKKYAPKPKPKKKKAPKKK